MKEIKSQSNIINTNENLLLLYKETLNKIKTIRNFTVNKKLREIQENNNYVNKNKNLTKDEIIYVYKEIIKEYKLYPPFYSISTLHIFD